MLSFPSVRSNERSIPIRMSDASSDTGASFSSSPDPDFGRDWEDEGPSIENGSSWGDRSAFALDMARMWVKTNQKKAMLGAFATGVFVGSLFRD